MRLNYFFSLHIYLFLLILWIVMVNIVGYSIFFLLGAIFYLIHQWKLYSFTLLYVQVSCVICLSCPFKRDLYLYSYVNSIFLKFIFGLYLYSYINIEIIFIIYAITCIYTHILVWSLCFCVIYTRTIFVLIY
jgi:hypothetical protein